MEDCLAATNKISDKKRLFTKLFFHFVFLAHHWVVGIFSIIYLSCVKNDPDVGILYIYMPYFVTNWNITFQTMFLCLALFYDVLQWIDKHGSTIGKQIRYMRDILFNGLVGPFTCFVAAMFWGVYAIDRELIFPEVYDALLPWWLNHCVHTNILVVLAVETILQSRRFPTDLKVETFLYAFVSVFYAVVYYSIFFFAHIWLYGVFGVMTWWQICIYQILVWASAYIFYNMIFIINRMIHGPERLEETSPNEDDGEKAQDLKQFGSGVNGGRSQLKSVNEVATDGENEVDDGEDNDCGMSFKSDDENAKVTRLNGNGIKTNDDSVKAAEENETNVTNELENGKLNENHNGMEEIKKEWRSIETNGVSEKDEHSNTFDKSWSTKYRTNRKQFENSSL